MSSAPSDGPGRSSPCDAAEQAAELERSPAFREAALGMAVLALDFRILRVNASLARNFGYRTAEMENLPPDRFTHPEDIPRLQETLARALATGEAPPPFRKRCLRKDGAARPCELTVSRLPGAEGGWLAQVADVTERENALAQLERERRLFVGGPVVVFRWVNAPGWPVEYVSRNVRAEFGWEAEDLLSGTVPYADLVHPEDLPRVAAVVAAQAAGGSATFEKTYRLKDSGGRWRWIRDFTVAHREPSGELTHFEGYIFDDTRRVEAERASAQHEADLARLLSFSRAVLTAGDQRELLRVVQAELAQRIGAEHAWLYLLEPGEPRRAKLLAAAGPRFAAGAAPPERVAVSDSALLRRSLAADAPFAVGGADDGEMDPLRLAEARSLLAAPFPGDSGPAAVLWAGRGAAGGGDLAQKDMEYFRSLAGIAALAFGRIRADQEGRAAQARLRQVEKLQAVGQLAGGVAHNFNNALTVILGHASLLHEAAPPGSPLRSGLETILRAGEVSSRAVSQLLQFARPHPLGGVERVQPAEALAEFGKMLRAVLDESIRFSVRCEEDLPEVETEGGAFPMILMNLVLNARDALEGGGKLVIRAAAERRGGRRWLRLEVEDDGIGMEPGVQARIFEPFFTTKGDRGTGLGLPAVYGAVTRAGGTVEVRSAPGRGSCFTIRLPEAVAEQRQQAQEPPPRGAAGGGRVLVIEDDEAVRLFAARALRSAGHRVESVAQASAALQILARGERFDLVLSDVVMPGMDGFELAQRIAALPRPPAVLLMSGYPGRGGDAHLPATVRGLLQKPFSAGALAAAAARALGGDAEAAAGGARS